ncbi:DNA alkylation repair protein [Candidatus Saccharibacteria bacterium]|nr:DNA alkylation repair protein [Candidatus Saccharibacteria bacterium]
MWYDKVFVELEKLGDDKQGEKMSAYMQNKFPFLGIPKPKLKELEKMFLSELKKSNDIDWDFVDTCWKKDYREAQYIALDYLGTKAKKLAKDDLEKLKKLITTKSWWETVDTIDEYVGEIVAKNPELEQEMISWSKDSDFWVRRVAINFQQKYKGKTNAELLEKIMVNNFGSSEFFINKAIGWSLRDYSKVNPTWVKDFLKKYNGKLDKLSIKEASKYL